MPLERETERKAREYARANGHLLLKFVSPGTVGVPDRILIGDIGRAAFLEFKQEGLGATPAQRHWLDLLAERGFTTDVIHNLEEFKRVMGRLYSST